MTTEGWPPALQEIQEMFAEVSARDRLDLLIEFALSLPDLPPSLAESRESLEQVHECQTPVFLAAEQKDGRIFYHIDVPMESPTVRGFASILQQGLSGARPEEIAATPIELYGPLGLGEVLSPLRLRGLTALLSRMKRIAREQENG